MFSCLLCLLLKGFPEVVLVLHSAIILFGAEVLSFLGLPLAPFCLAVCCLYKVLALQLCSATLNIKSLHFPSAFCGAFVGLHLSLTHLQLWKVRESATLEGKCWTWRQAVSGMWRVDSFEVLPTFLHRVPAGWGLSCPMMVISSWCSD